MPKKLNTIKAFLTSPMNALLTKNGFSIFQIIQPLFFNLFNKHCCYYFNINLK